MAGKLLQKWKSLSEGDESYVKGKTYAPISSLLQDLSEGQKGLALNLRGNQPLFKNNRLEDKDVALLCSALEELQSVCCLISLDLSYNRLTERAMFYVACYLKIQGCTLRTLRLSYNDIGAEGVEHLCNGLLVNTSVREVDLEGCKMGCEGGLQLAARMQVNTSIRTLKVANADLNADAIIAMATILHGNNTLEVLDISRPLLFSCREETSRHLSDAMKVNCGLCELHLSKHSMTDTGLEWLCRALSENTTLLVLNVSSNEFSRDGARHLSTLLSKNPPLRELVLSYNRIEDEGLAWISQVIASSNSNLEKLNVDFNSIGDVGLCALAKSLQHNSTLCYLTIWGNNIQQLTCKAFTELLASGRLSEANIDVRPYEVDQQMYLARTNAAQHSHPM